MVFSEQLFPVEFSTENRVNCWIVSFDAFDEKCVKAFERVLSEKQRYEKHLLFRVCFCVDFFVLSFDHLCFSRLHQEMQIYLASLPKLKVKYLAVLSEPEFCLDPPPHSGLVWHHPKSMTSFLLRIKRPRRMRRVCRELAKGWQIFLLILLKHFCTFRS